MKSKELTHIFITLLLLVIMFLISTLVYQIEIYESTKKADDLALTLSQVNELLDERSVIVVQINEILDRTGYSHLKRKVVIKVEEE